MDASYKRIAWNGLSLKAPRSWEVTTLERDFMAVSEDGNPLMEIKWRVVPGRFSMDRHRARLAKENRGAEFVTPVAGMLPDEFNRALDVLVKSGMQVEPFQWAEKDGGEGLGAVLHNPATRLAAIVQFFLSSVDAGSAAAALTSIRDHAAGDTMPWDMFGLSFRLPQDMRLASFSFRPGAFSLDFFRPVKERGDDPPKTRMPGTRVHIDRMAPATVILGPQTIDAWAKEYFKPPVPMNDSGWTGVTGDTTIGRLTRKLRHHRGHVWIPPNTNDILALRTTGHLPVSDSEFNGIRKSYAMVQEG